MKNYRRSDLACEATESLDKIEGTEYSKMGHGKYIKEIIKINTRAAAERLKKKIGTYITVTTPEIWTLDDSELSELSGLLAEELIKLLCMATNRKKVDRNFSVLVVGLGNTLITVDAIGPRTLEHLEVTRHIKLLDPSLFGMLGTCEISAIAPGVLGRTGIESAEIVKSACHQVKPHAVIVIDALAAGAVERLACTVQLSDTGISPGAGMGNFRAELSMNTLGCPVIALGVPTVVDSSAVVYDAICRAGISDSIPDELIRHLDRSERFYVTPKESDLMTEKISVILANAISSALVII